MCASSLADPIREHSSGAMLVYTQACPCAFHLSRRCSVRDDAMKTARPRSSRGRAADFHSKDRCPLDLLILLQVIAGLVLGIQRSIGLLRLVADFDLGEIKSDRVHRQSAALTGFASTGLIRRDQQIRKRPGQVFLLL